MTLLKLKFVLLSSKIGGKDRNAKDVVLWSVVDLHSLAALQCIHYGSFYGLTLCRYLL